jgi:hypothetical protein
LSSHRDNAGEINAQLRAIYAPVWLAAVRELPKDRLLSVPLFLSVSAEFASSPRRFLVVGKQTMLWPPRSDFAAWAREDALDELFQKYREFAFGADRPGAPFWTAAHLLREAANPLSDRSAMAWTNVIKLDQGGDQPDSEWEAWIDKYNLLEREIEVLRPDIVVFFTGPALDERLRGAFQGLSFREESRFVARLSHGALPDQAYRSYHPNWLRRSKNWAEIGRLCNLISKS